MNKDILHFYTSFQGRATRADFNVRFAVVAFIGWIVAAILDFSFISHGNLMEATSKDGPFSTFWNLMMIVPTLAITCRRLHDLNHSGWWQAGIYAMSSVIVIVLVMTLGLSALINPLVAGFGGLLALLGVAIAYLLFFIFLSMKRGTKGPNKYGPDPLEVVV